MPNPWLIAGFVVIGTVAVVGTALVLKEMFQPEMPHYYYEPSVDNKKSKDPDNKDEDTKDPDNEEELKRIYFELEEQHARQGSRNESETEKKRKQALIDAFNKHIEDQKILFKKDD